jgi:uncharacterized OB-fold protein
MTKHDGGPGAASAPFPGRPDIPVTPETRDWWDATREGRLTVQRCVPCGHVQWYPRVLCTACGGTDLVLDQASGRGEIYSFTVVHRSPDPASFVPPYVVALVRLAEGPVITTNIIGPGSAAVRCDEPVHLTWERLPDGRQLPLFQAGPAD